MIAEKGDLLDQYLETNFTAKVVREPAGSRVHCFLVHAKCGFHEFEV